MVGEPEGIEMLAMHALFLSGDYLVKRRVVIRKSGETSGQPPTSKFHIRRSRGNANKLSTAPKARSTYPTPLPSSLSHKGRGKNKTHKKQNPQRSHAAGSTTTKMNDQLHRYALQRSDALFQRGMRHEQALQPLRETTIDPERGHLVRQR
jgi:hypothetical protein